MPKFIVQHTHIKHSRGKKDKPRTYAPGEEIDLSEKEAQPLGNNLLPVGSAKLFDPGNQEGGSSQEEAPGGEEGGTPGENPSEPAE